MKKYLVLALGVLAVAVLLENGCLIRGQSGEVGVSGPVVEFGWEPIYYDGYVVYYTDDGIPFYYGGGAQIWIPDHERYYYTERYTQRREAYHTWYQQRGRQYYGYRQPDRPSFHQGRPVVQPRETEEHRPVVQPRETEEHRPVVQPQETEVHRPVVRPRDDGEHKPVIRPHNDVKQKPVVRHKNNNDDNKHKIDPR